MLWFGKHTSVFPNHRKWLQIKAALNREAVKIHWKESTAERQATLASTMEPRPERAPHYLSTTLSSVRLKRPTEVNEKVSMEINEVSVRL